MGNKYMHLLEGHPAFFDGDQICFAGRGCLLSSMLRDSLTQIRKEQKLSDAFRKEHGWRDFKTGYGHLRIKID